MNTNGQDGQDGYGAGSIKALTGLQAVRKRPGMYIGGTGSDGLTRLLWEAADNAADEAAEGYGTLIEITLHADGSYSVADRGRGIPVGEHPSGRSALVVVFTELHAGGKFGTAGYTASTGAHGVGLAVINALSERVTVNVRRRGRAWRQHFRARKPVRRASDGAWQPSDRPEPDGPAESSGTVVRWWPDMRLFDPGAKISYQQVKARAWELACLLPAGVRVRTTCERTGRTDEAASSAGLADLLPEGAGEPVTLPIAAAGEAGYTERAPNPQGEIVDHQRVCRVEAVLRWHTRPGMGVRSFVNTAATPDGGTHEDGLARAVAAELRREIERRDPPKLRRRGAKPSQADCCHGLTAVLRVRIPEPQFASQTKTRLTAAPARQAVAETVREAVAAYLAGDHPAARKTHIGRLVRHVVNAACARLDEAEAAAAGKAIGGLRRSPALAKLADCRLKGGELLIVEGDSAAGPAKQARDARWQAVLPLRGKIVNAAKAAPTQITANAEAAALIAAVGAGCGPKFDPATARYDRVVLLADADVDGAHIRCLLLTLLWNQMRPLIEAGRVYAACPPTHAVVPAGGGRKQFAWNNRQLADASEQAGPGSAVVRFKGLGEMNADELRVTCLDPDTRVLRQVTVADAERAANAIRDLMGRDSAARRKRVMDTATAGAR